MEKRFPDWMGIKKNLHEKLTVPPKVNEGDVWWASIGENIGSEINGKNQNFTRPVIILKKLSRTLFFVIPLTTKLKYGTWFVTYEFQSYEVTACLHQVRTIDYRRLWSRLGRLDKSNLEIIKLRLNKLYF